MKKVFFFVVTLGMFGVASAAYYGWLEVSRVLSDDPLVWEEVIVELEQKTERQNPPDDAVLFVGSSSIRFWDTLAEDMSPLSVIQHGFGGAKVADVVHYAERLILRWQPDKVVIFVGSNDINVGDEHDAAPLHVSAQLEVLLDRIFASNPQTEVFYIAITPTLYSWDKWDSVQKVNQYSKAVCERYENATFIETADLFLNAQGKPNKDLFIFDGLHLNEAGYALWTKRIKPFLLQGSD